MIERIDDMPEGTIGFRAAGRVTRDEYRQTLEPAMRAAAEASEVRMLFVVTAEFERFEAGALMEDTKTGVQLGLGHLAAWKRTGLVTDLEWMRNALHFFAWMAPGEVQVFGLDQVDAAKEWVAG